MDVTCYSLRRSRECSVSRQYLCQAALVLAGLSILALNTVRNVLISNNNNNNNNNTSLAPPRHQP